MEWERREGYQPPENDLSEALLYKTGNLSVDVVNDQMRKISLVNNTTSAVVAGKRTWHLTRTTTQVRLLERSRALFKDISSTRETLRDSKTFQNV